MADDQACNNQDADCPPPINGLWSWKGDDATLATARHNIAQAIMDVQAALTQHAYQPLLLK